VKEELNACIMQILYITSRSQELSRIETGSDKDLRGWKNVIEGSGGSGIQVEGLVRIIIQKHSF
jgi:hypothetical protein